MAKKTKENTEVLPVEESNNDFQKYTEKEEYTFFVKTVKELAIPFKFLEFPCTRDGHPSHGFYMQPTKDGDIRFFTPSIDGEIESYTTDTANIKVHDWYMTRFQEPKKTSDGEFAKYMPVRGGGTRLQITPSVLDAYKNKTQINDLFLIEGFKKSLALWFHSGYHVIGMNGLTGFKEPSKERIRAELKDILIVCNVKRVIIVYDSDLFDIGNGKENPESFRPNNFYRAAISAKNLIEQFSDVCLVHPVPGEKKLGFDDLLYEQAKHVFSNEDLLLTKRKADPGRDKVIKFLDNCLVDGTNEMFSICRLSSISDYKIKEYFHLDDVVSFYTYHKEKLKQRPSFRFGTYKYRIREDGTPEEIKEVENFGYKVKDNCILRNGGVDKDGDRKDDVLIANFIMKILFHIKGDENIRVAEFTNNRNQRAIVEFTSEDIASPQRFLSLCINEGEFIFYGSKDDLIRIFAMIVKHEKQAVVFSSLGYQPDYGVFAFANGIATNDGWKACDEYGIVEHNDSYFYFPAFSKFNTGKIDRFADERKYVHIPGERVYTFEQWKNQFCKVYGKNGVITVCFYLATLFSDIVFKHKSGIGFPLLFASGKPKTGKSTIFISLLKLFGDGLSGESLTSNSTFKFLFTQFAKMRNGLVFLDEYSNDNPKTFDVLKNIFDRRPYGTKQYSNDNKTRIVPVICPACVAGEVLPTGNHALFTRTISMVFNTIEDNRTDAEKEEFRKLSRMEENGLTSITVNLVKYRHFINNNFDKVYMEVSSDLDFEFRKLVIDGRMKKSAKWILTVVKILIDEKVIDFNQDWKDIISIWKDLLYQQNLQIQTNTDSAKFWEIIESLHRNGIISEDAGDFKFEGDLLVIRLGRLVIPYQKRANELHYSKILDKGSLKNYLENESYYVEMVNADGTPKLTRFLGSSSPTSGLWLDYAALSEKYGIDLTKQNYFIKGNSNPEKQSDNKNESTNDNQKDLPF